MLNGVALANSAKSLIAWRASVFVISASQMVEVQRPLHCWQTSGRSLKSTLPRTHQAPAVTFSILHSARKPEKKPEKDGHQQAIQLRDAGRRVVRARSFVYAPMYAIYEQHGHSTERDLIYVTTQNLRPDQLPQLSG